MNILKNPHVRLFAGATVTSFAAVFVSLANMQVFFMIAAGVLFLGQRPSVRQIVAIPLAIIGLAMVVGLDWSVLSMDYRVGVIFGLLTAVCFAGYMLFMRQALIQTSHTVPIREVAVMSFLVAAMLGAVVLIEGDSLLIESAADVGWLLAYGLLSHSVGLMLIASSLTKVSTTEVGIALLLQPSLSFVWDVLFFGRTVTAIELSGAVIALLAIFLGSTRRSKQAQRAA